eukprot:TRINITY_DN29766_c0_g1_i2.p1 TRINITY_DN29766_c0_g1~~TRINITY_DN29766_c0_g1_i2.p1  ORF type:complete len:817 (-),score=132.91 TRINITY_DN29766_c0_g1_i2:857-3307(-)
MTTTSRTRLLALLLAAPCRETLGQTMRSCFKNADEMAYCCSGEDSCFGSEERYAGKTRALCCGPEFVQMLVHSVNEAMKESDQEGFGVSISILHSVLFGVDALSMDAWAALVRAVSRRAILQYDDLTEKGVPDVFLALEGSSDKALAIARELNYAAHLCEIYFQVLWYNHARVLGRAAVEISFDDIRPLFQETLDAYKLIQEALDTLTYYPIGRNSRMPTAALSADERLGLSTKVSDVVEVVLVVTVLGAWARVAAVTLWSILRSRSCALRIFVFGDDVGIQDWRGLVKEIREEFPAVLKAVRFDYVNIFLHPRMLSYKARLPARCAQSNMSFALFSRLICHEMLPRDVKRAIAVDLGDVIVFDDILGLWREGDLLEAHELLAAASHRAIEEEMRHGKPSMLNGGVVLYEVDRMRASSYTEDTIRAAEHGLQRRYSHFCAWDQDIINVMYEDLWGKRGVRVLPCRWSLFPVTSWQFFWNTPSHWPKELFELRRYPGLLAADHIEHFCPDDIHMLHQVFAFSEPHMQAVARDVAVMTGKRNRQEGARVRAPDGTICLCGERAALLHVPSTMKLWPWSHRLFAHHAPPFIEAAAAAGDFITGRQEQVEDFGGGFWGAEDHNDLAAASDFMIHSSKNADAEIVATGNCVTLPSDHGSYARVDFLGNKGAVQRQLSLQVETFVEEDAHIFIGLILNDGSQEGQLTAGGVEVVFGAYRNAKSAIRWGVQGLELAARQGAALESGIGADASNKTRSGGWSKIWVTVSDDGDVVAGKGKIEDDAVLMRAKVIGDVGGANLVSGTNVYVGTPVFTKARWVVCRA